MKKRLISFNVHYAPESFGGATIVAEEVNSLLAQRYDWSILVVTTVRKPEFLPYHLFRYTTKDVDIVAINLPLEQSHEEQYDNPKITEAVHTIAQRFRPDVAHLHSIQFMGVGIISALHQNNVPVAITFHDCWWLCQRQFMINRHEKYCFQKRIDENVCLHCVDNLNIESIRKRLMASALQKTDRYLFTSQFHHDLHILNDFDESKSYINKNGVRVPDSSFTKKRSKKIRFGFTGGPGPIKGFEMIKQVFGQLDDANYVLKLVDAAGNLGLSWGHHLKALKAKGKVQIIEPYTQETMDDFFGEIDVLLFPSLWKESFGLTVREALLRDVWVISTNGGGTAEDLRHGLNSTVIPLTTDPSYLNTAVKEVLSKDWSNYKNEYKSDIRSFEDQAHELHGLLSAMIQQ